MVFIKYLFRQLIGHEHLNDDFMMESSANVKEFAERRENSESELHFALMHRLL
jgi:hypothetical protein